MAVGQRLQHQTAQASGSNAAIQMTSRVFRCSLSFMLVRRHLVAWTFKTPSVSPAVPRQGAKSQVISLHMLRNIDPGTFLLELSTPALRPSEHRPVIPVPYGAHGFYQV